MLRNVLASIAVVFFVVSGLVMVVTGDAETRWLGLGSLAFFGGLGLLALAQAVLARLGKPSLALALFGLAYLAGCSLFLGLNANMFGEPGDILMNPTVVHGFGFGGFVLLTAYLLGLSVWLWYRGYTRWQPKTPEEAEQMGQQAVRRWQDQQVVTREWMVASIEQMNGQIHCLSPFYFDIRGPATPTHVLVDEWVEAKRPEWFDAFLEAIAHPPPMADDLYEAEELWRNSTSQLLAAWVCSDPDRLFDRISRIVSVEAARPVLLETFAQIADTACIQKAPKGGSRWPSG